LFGVDIKKVNIENGATFTESSILNITGNAKNAIYLSLNDREISINEQGNFNETISLLPGYNTITIVAKDKFGNSDEENYQLIYKPKIPVSDPILPPASQDQKEEQKEAVSETTETKTEIDSVIQ
jgi:hypothetical protein